jgi:hypothetical protein
LSTLSIRLKQRANVLAAGAVLSDATLAYLPGVAEAKNSTRDSAGTVQGVHASPKAATQASGSDNKADSPSRGGNSGGGSEKGASDSIGASQGVNVSPDATTQVSLTGDHNTAHPKGNKGVGSSPPPYSTKWIA